MRDIFYGILLFLLISLIYTAATTKRYVNLDHRKDGIIIHVSTDYLTGIVVYTQTPDDSIHHDFVYEMAIKDLELGDTIKVR